MLFVCVSSVTWNPTNVFTIKDGIGWLSMYYTELKRILWQDWQVALPKLCDWHELKDIKILMNIDHINKIKNIGRNPIVDCEQNGEKNRK